jgi:hypothetical protein
MRKTCLLGRLRQTGKDRFIATIGVATALLGAVPLCVYALQRVTGLIPDERTWLYELGHNHGPWRETAWFFVYFPFLVLAPLTLVVGAARAARRRSVDLALAVMLLVALQVAASFLHLEHLYWLID